MATPPRMKIKVTDLIARIEKQHKDNVKEYDKRKRKYDREKASYLKLVAENVPRNREKVVEVIEREIKNLQKQRLDILAGKEDKHLLNGTYNAFDRYRYVNLENIVNDRDGFGMRPKRSVREIADDQQFVRGKKCRN